MTSTLAAHRVLYSVYTPATYEADGTLAPVKADAVWTAGAFLIASEASLTAVLADLHEPTPKVDSGTLVDMRLPYTEARNRLHFLLDLSFKAESLRLTLTSSASRHMFSDKGLREATNEVAEAHRAFQAFLREATTTFSQVCLDTRHQKLRMAICWGRLTKEQASPSAKFVSMSSSTKDAPYV